MSKKLNYIYARVPTCDLEGSEEEKNKIASEKLEKQIEIISRIYTNYIVIRDIGHVFSERSVGFNKIWQALRFDEKEGPNLGTIVIAHQDIFGDMYDILKMVMSKIHNAKLIELNLEEYKMSDLEKNLYPKYRDELKLQAGEVV